MGIKTFYDTSTTIFKTIFSLFIISQTEMFQRYLKCHKMKFGQILIMYEPFHILYCCFIFYIKVHLHLRYHLPLEYYRVLVVFGLACHFVWLIYVLKLWVLMMMLRVLMMMSTKKEILNFPWQLVIHLFFSFHPVFLHHQWNCT